MELVLSNVNKSFGNKEVLKDISCSFAKGKIYGLLGRNGAGKTTLFNCLSGEILPDQGTAILQQETAQTPLDISHIGYVYSTPILPEFLTGYEFIRFYIDINKKYVDPDKSIDDYFNMLDLSESDRHRLIKDYSHGMKNKIQMLCFIIAKPPVILLDEPLTSLDVVVALEIKKILREICKDRIIIFSTHILQLATDLCDEIVILSDGKLEHIDYHLLQSNEFEEKIISLLKEES